MIDTGSGVGILHQLAHVSIPLAAIKYIFLSHTDFDHCNGLGPLLLAKALQRTRSEESITILGSPAVVKMLQSIIRFTAPDVLHLWEEHLHWQPLFTDLPYQISSDVVITPFFSSHQPSDYQAMGLALEVNGIHICYSSDTRPHPSLNKHAAQAQYLIHEASFFDEQRELAHLLGHSTAADAGMTASAANAARLILVHLNVNSSVDEEIMAAEAQLYYRGPITVAHDFFEVLLEDSE